MKPPAQLRALVEVEVETLVAAGLGRGWGQRVAVLGASVGGAELLLVALLELDLQMLALDRKPMHALDGCRAELCLCETDEPKSSWSAIVVCLHTAAEDLPEVFEMLSKNFVIPAIRDVVYEQIRTDWPHCRADVTVLLSSILSVSILPSRCFNHAWRRLNGCLCGLDCLGSRHGVKL
eukprot:CAMPEP_0195022020 /NCGR_PEP_ID=MMETSP0326_2-20130528/39403_1 /TAXON_ID=2866 ORGANISM="Crypthecodinium cohnii, Strain Seligo" /NCGR_SAMPLE_ID=MMETSP0326_2 /ASSEMBLY_ACC=CAM_ASM_000348 /LENGTH=177 /DNA_ID=CAMNT_0040041545 /DNA_START=62 /DNA_END=594 /DNA_ORIENTATION=-